MLSLAFYAHTRTVGFYLSKFSGAKHINEYAKYMHVTTGLGGGVGRNSSSPCAPRLDVH